MKPYVLGLDIGGTKCAVLLAVISGGIHIKDKIRFDSRTEKGFAYTYGLLCDAIEQILRGNQVPIEAVSAIGVSCGGPLDSRRGVVLCPPNLPGWVDIPLKQMLEERFGIPTFLQNDANACALVEWKLGAGRGCRDMIFLTMGTGMGGGVIAEGQLLRGNTDMGGEIGHLRLSEDGPVGFGKAGSFEGWTSGGGIGRQAVEMTRALIAEGNAPQWIRDGHTEDEVTARLMAEYARKGEPNAIRLYETVGRMLGKGLALLVDAFNPECVVIGSIFVRCEELLRPAMEEELKKEAIPFSLNGLRIVPAQTGEQLGDLASILVALYGQGRMDLVNETHEREQVNAHYERLFERYPQLSSCRESVAEAYQLLIRCYEQGGKVLLVGNGGSCADCEHIAGELLKGFYLKRPLDHSRKEAVRRETAHLMPQAADLLQQGLPAIALTGHTALTTAVQNDLSPVLAPAQQVLAYGRPGDVVIGISTSGNAENVALAAATAKGLGLTVIGLTGGTGGRLKGLCDCAIIAPGTSPADIQELHLPIYHTLCAMVEAHFFEE